MLTKPRVSRSGPRDLPWAVSWKEGAVPFHSHCETWEGAVRMAGWVSTIRSPAYSDQWVRFGRRVK
jgi:hypothetical protein